MSQSTASARLVNVTHGNLARDTRNARRRARTVSASSVAHDALVDLLANPGRHAYGIAAEHGGSVPNNYGFAATTDAVVCVAVPDGPGAAKVVGFAAELPANKVRLAGVGATVGLRDLFDDRVTRQERVDAAHRRAAEIGRDTAEAVLRVELPEGLLAVLLDATLPAESRKSLALDALEDAGVDATALRGLSLAGVVRSILD